MLPKQTVMFTFKSSAPSFRKRFGLKKLLFVIFALHTVAALQTAFHHAEMAKGLHMLERDANIPPDPSSPHTMADLFWECILKNNLEQ